MIFPAKLQGMLISFSKKKKYPGEGGVSRSC